MSHDVFISHSSNDKLVADAVCSTLERESIRCWIAPRDIRPGDSWGSSIIKGIEDSSVMVIIFSKNANASQQVMREVERAVQKNVVVVPFRIDGVEPSADMEYFLSATHWLDAMTPEMDAHLDKLAATIKSILNRSDGKTPEPGSASSEAATTSPPVSAAPKPATAASSKSAPIVAEKKNKKLFLIAGAVLAVLLIALWIMMPSGSDEKDASKEVVVGDGNIKLTMAERAIAAEFLEIKIKGKTGDKDYIFIGKSDSNDRSSLKRVNVDGNKTVSLELPGSEGLYEVRYYDAAQRKVIARQSLKITNPEVTLDAVKESLANTQIDVTWTAPNNDRDYLAIAEKGSPASKYIHYANTAKGSPTTIRVPNVEGDYEIRYISGKDRVVWASRDFKALEPKASVDAPDTAAVGSMIQIEWTGPALQGDYVCVAEPSSEGKKYLKYRYVKQGTKVELQMPDDPGSYEIRYISGGSSIIRDSKPIKITAVEVEIDGIGELEAEAAFTVNFSGPGNVRDYLAIFKSGETSGKYLSYKYVTKGNSLQFKAPAEPGNYVMKYISGQKKREWATREFTVKPNE